MKRKDRLQRTWGLKVEQKKKRKRGRGRRTNWTKRSDRYRRNRGKRQRSKTGKYAGKRRIYV